MKKGVFIGFFFLFFTSLILCAQKEFVIVPPAAFHGASETSDYAYYFEGPDHYVRKKFSGGYLYAPLYFPPDASGKFVRSLQVLIDDSSITSRIEVTLYRQNHITGEYQEVFHVETGDDSFTGKHLRSDITGVGRRINNKWYSWFLWVFMGPGGSYFEPESIKLYSVRIKYK
jgi:hypothetical protein